MIISNPSKARIYRIIYGACRNVAHHHPDFKLQYASSIAKRAAGTLTAEWPDVLAARRPAFLARRQMAKVHRLRLSSGRSSGASPRRPPVGLKRLWNKLAREVGPAKREGRTERAETLIEVLRLIADMQRERAL